MIIMDEEAMMGLVDLGEVHMTHKTRLLNIIERWGNEQKALIVAILPLLIAFPEALAAYEKLARENQDLGEQYVESIQDIESDWNKIYGMLLNANKSQSGADRSRTDGGSDTPGPVAV